MLRLDEPQAVSVTPGSTQRMTLAVSCATRPYSSAVFWQICHGPSISLPRHQNLMPCGFSKSVRATQVGIVCAARMVAVFDEMARLVRPARAEIDREHRLDPGRLAPGHEFVGTELRWSRCFPRRDRDASAAAPSGRRRPPSCIQRENCRRDSARWWRPAPWSAPARPAAKPFASAVGCPARRCRHRRSGPCARRKCRTHAGPAATSTKSRSTTILLFSILGLPTKAD